MFDHLELSDRFPDLQAMDSRAFCSCPGIRGFVDRRERHFGGRPEREWSREW
jgi:hypothetical protein